MDNEFKWGDYGGFVVVFAGDFGGFVVYVRG